MASTARAFVLKARAKFNLCLEVGALERNGLHALRSAVADLLVCDEVAFLPSDRGFTVSCDDPAIPIQANLARRAAIELGVELPAVRIHIRKELPSQAGLGGGSADAAAALRGLSRLLEESGVTLSPEVVRAVAARVGSDVSACLVSGLKIVEGTGDIIRSVPADPPRWGVLLLKPAIGVSTADAFALLDRDRAAGSAKTQSPRDAIAGMCDAFAHGDFGRVCVSLHNDFQSAIEGAYPSVAEARRRVISAGAAAAILCGSGSCVAGLFESVGEAEKALALVRPGPGEWASATGFADGE